MEKVTEFLNKQQQDKRDAEESIKVNKLIPLKCYPKDLLIIDTNEIDLYKYRNDEDHLLRLTRDCIQHLVNSVSGGEKETKNEVAFLKISGESYNLPREKPIPQPKMLTKWEKFAMENNIKKKEKPRKIWDETLNKWVSSHGREKAEAEKMKNWIIEVPGNVDPNTDMFAERSKTKKDNVAKNEYHRLRNIAAAKKIKVPKVAVPPMEAKLHTSQLQVAADVARVSTASLGKYQPKLPHEGELKQPKTLKRKKPLLNAEQEKKVNMDIADKVLRKKPKLDLTRAVNQQIHEENYRKDDDKSKRKKGGKKKKSNDRKAKRKGVRAGGKMKGGGRKRR